MRAETALITIDGVTKLKVLLVPENEIEATFLIEAVETADDVDLSMQERADA